VHARSLRALGVQIAVGFKGVIRNACPLDRAGISAERAFREIVEESGYCFLLDPAELAARFKEIANAVALVSKGDAASAQALLQHLRTVPFDMVVGEQVANPRCSDAEDSFRSQKVTQDRQQEE
jgi:hypothetical protein